MIKLQYSNADQRGDLVRTAGLNLETDEGLETAVTISLFTDARAGDSDGLDPGADKRGWWGDIYLTPAGPLGSKLWLLQRSNVTANTLVLASKYAKDSLLWLVKASVASDIQVLTELMAGRRDVALMTIGIQRPSKTTPRFERAWAVQLGR